MSLVKISLCLSLLSGISYASTIMPSCPYQVSIDNKFPISLSSVNFEGNYTDQNGFGVMIHCLYGIDWIIYLYTDYSSNSNDIDPIINSINWNLIDPVSFQGYSRYQCKGTDPNYAGLGCQIQAVNRFFIGSSAKEAFRVISWSFPSPEKK